MNQTADVASGSAVPIKRGRGLSISLNAASRSCRFLRTPKGCPCEVWEPERHALRRRGKDETGSWSSERANATRGLLTDAGLTDSRVHTVTGHADRDPLLPADPLAAANRRIAIVVLREAHTTQPIEPVH